MTSQLLAGFITENRNLPYYFNQVDMQTRAHITSDTDSIPRNNKSEHRPIIVHFINWRVAEEVREKIIHLNSRNQLKVIVNQMFSIELTKCRNNTPIKRKEYLRLHSDLQIKVRLSSNIKVPPKRSKQQMADIGRILKKRKKEPGIMSRYIPLLSIFDYF